MVDRRPDHQAEEAAQLKRNAYLVLSILFAVSAAFWFVDWVKSGGHKLLYLADTVVFLIAASVWMYGYVKRRLR